MTDVIDAIILLHGWPGSVSDFRRLTPFLQEGPRQVGPRVIVPELLGFGGGFTGPIQSADATADSHGHRILALMDAAGIRRAVIAGYDIGSRIAQAIARIAPDRVTGLVVTPAYPGIGDRSLAPEMQSVFWYQHFHRTAVAADLIDGNEQAVRKYLSFIWGSWTAEPTLLQAPEFDQLVAEYARPGAFRASIEWYSVTRGYSDAVKIIVPTAMLWPGADPLFPVEWADAVEDWFEPATVTIVEGAGHFMPLEAPEVFAAAIREFTS